MTRCFGTSVSHRPQAFADIRPPALSTQAPGLMPPLAPHPPPHILPSGSGTGVLKTRGLPGQTSQPSRGARPVTGNQSSTGNTLMVRRVFGAEVVLLLPPTLSVALHCPQNKVHTQKKKKVPTQSTPCIALLPSLSPLGFPFFPVPCAAATLASFQPPGMHCFLTTALNLFSSRESSPFVFPPFFP